MTLDGPDWKQLSMNFDPNYCKGCGRKHVTKRHCHSCGDLHNRKDAWNRFAPTCDKCALREAASVLGPSTGVLREP